VGDLTKADLEGKVVFVRADLNVSARQRQTESGLVVAHA
jgi:3-phosphoglycerate kinase